MKDCQSGVNKRKLRQAMKEKRNETDESFRQEASAVIEDKIVKMEQYKSATIMMFYMTHGSEVKTENIIRRALKENKTVVLPSVVSKSDRKISAVQVKDIDSDIVVGSYGIREPKPGNKEIDKNKIDLVFVPGVVFDEEGFRIGYGKGFYDKC
ncbi:5-formyltetrahydrofolate cyclo-ligase [Elusimicrobiota bacterium]